MQISAVKNGNILNKRGWLKSEAPLDVTHQTCGGLKKTERSDSGDQNLDQSNANVVILCHFCICHTSLGFRNPQTAANFLSNSQKVQC